MTVIDTQAAELEGLVQINADQLALVKRRRQLAARKAKIEAEMADIRDTLLGELDADAQMGLVHDGQVIVRKIVVNSTKLDTKALKEKFPEIANSLAVTSTYVRVDIS